jgi:hypothetical protein
VLIVATKILLIFLLDGTWTTDQLFKLKFTVKQLQRLSKKAEKEEKASRNKLKKVSLRTSSLILSPPILCKQFHIFIICSLMHMKSFGTKKFSQHRKDIFRIFPVLFLFAMQHESIF